MASSFFHTMDDLDTMAAGSYYKNTVTDTMNTESNFLNKEEEENETYVRQPGTLPDANGMTVQEEQEYEYYDEYEDVNVLEDQQPMGKTSSIHKVASNSNSSSVAQHGYTSTIVYKEQPGSLNEQQQEEEDEHEEDVKHLDPGYDQVLSGPSLRNLNQQQSESSYSSDDPSSDDSSYATGSD